MKEGLTTPGGMWRYGDDFRKAAECVLERYQAPSFAPYYFLVGQSIELLLKAFLMRKGLSVTVLKKKPYGHDLKSILSEALRHDLGKLVNLESKHKGAIGLLGWEYVVKRFQYIQTGTKVTPYPELVQEAAERLAKGLAAYCSDETIPLP